MGDSYGRNVFINCPFDADYFELLRPLLFTIVYFGFKPRIALESSDSGRARVSKILQLIKESKYSIHDLSRLRAKNIDDYYRLNMPFELGVDFGIRYSEARYSDKRTLILEKDKFEYMKAISDLNGFDIKNHSNDIEQLISCLRSWFSETVCIHDLNTSSKIFSDYTLFQRDLFDRKTLKYKGEHNSTEAEHFATDEIKELTIPEFINEVKEWKGRRD